VTGAVIAAARALVAAEIGAALVAIVVDLRIAAARTAVETEAAIVVETAAASVPT
jgi:hypothetical protein